MYIIGDVAGQYNTLLALIAKLTPNEDIVLLGDLVDRGPDSAKVVEYAKANSDRIKVIKGNHEDMMIDYHNGTNRYDPDVWKYNGGYMTMQSYKGHMDWLMPHIEFLEQLPLFLIYDDLYLSHAPFTVDAKIDEDVMWNRNEPDILEDKYMIFGHNSYWGLTITNEWACIDTSGSEVLTAMHWPSKAIIQQEYI